MPTKAELERENARLRKERDSLFKDKVKFRDLLINYARDMGWDKSDTNTMLSDLKMQPEPSYHRQWVTIRAHINWDEDEVPDGKPDIRAIKLLRPDSMGYERVFEVEEWDCHFEDEPEAVYD